MSLDSQQLDAIRVFLQTNLLFYTSVSPLRDRPFEFPDAPRERGTLQEAAATIPRKRLLRTLFLSGLFLFFSSAVWEDLLWQLNRIQESKQLPPVSPLENLEQYILHVLSFSPENLPHELFHSMPILCMALGILLLLAAGVFLILEAPAHQADPLLARLLQETLHSKSSPSSSYVQSLLANLRFKKIFQRAVFTVFPLEATPLETAQVLQTSPMVRDPASVSPEWNNFVTRLLDTLSDHEPFVHFIENHPATPPEKLYKGGLQELLDYGMRYLLFTEILGDPDCAFLYRNTSDLWQRVLHWISTVDLKKLFDLLPKTEKASGGTDKNSVALYLLLGLLLALLLQKLPWPASSGGEKPNQPTPPTAITVTLDANQFAEKLAELIAKLCQQCAPQPQQPPPPPPPISISVPVSPGPAINIPPLNLPSRIEVALSSTAPAAKTEIQQNVNTFAATPKASGPPPDGTPVAGAAMQGDTLVSFTRSQPPQQPQDFSSRFTLHTSSGEDCPYTATLPETANKWPPDPVLMAVQSSGTLPKACPQIPPQGATISVSRKPLYNDILKAYVSLDEKHARHLRLFGHDQIVVLIHYATPAF
jgi:hypothetical protein